MEKVLKSKKLGETSKALSAENQRLREELQQAKVSERTSCKTERAA